MIMLKKNVKIINKHGLHARPATVLVTHASRFESDIFITYKEMRVNAKSILGVLVLAVEPGAEITFEADGKDEEKAIEKLLDLVRNKFYTEQL